MHPIVDTEWLARESGPGLRVVDMRWYLDPARSGRDAGRAGHVPGAAFVDIDRELSAPGGGRSLAAGRDPWPAAVQVARGGVSGDEPG